MVQKEEERRLGRPRAYDPQVALQRAMEAFGDGGFSGTSLDDLSKRTGMNRPSLYAAFGDKQALYLKTMESYLAARRAGLAAALSGERPLREALRDAYKRMIDRFMTGESGARGCYLIGTAVTEAVQNPKVRETLTKSLGELDELFRTAFAAAQARGELDKKADPQALAVVASAVAHTLALRARSGQPRTVLQGLADAAVPLICGPRPVKRGARHPLGARGRSKRGDNHHESP
jgi:AcrR family transcriptional regulator